MIMVKHDAPPLMARQYRDLWLNDAHQLGLIAETLADALGWQPTADQPVPDPLELAQAAAERLLELEAQCVFATLTRRVGADSKLQHLAFSHN